MLDQTKSGNIFLDNEKVELRVRTDGDAVDWTATDFFGAQTHGAAPVDHQTGQAAVHPGNGRTGYFALHLAARRESLTTAQADTCFAVVGPPSGDPPFGVMTHFAQGWDPDLMPLIVRAGLRHIRDEQYWQEVEPRRGTYNFSRYAAYLAAALKNGLDPLTELTFGNNRYDHDPAAPATAFAPCTDDGRTGFANYARALLDHGGAWINTVEVWNEYNGTWCAGPASGDRPRYYTDMLRRTYTAIKAQRPGVRVLGGASVLTPLPWFEDLFGHGALDFMDAIVIHPYRGVPEGVEKDVAALRDLAANYNHGQGPKPIWATECGDGDNAHAGRPDMARYLVRLLTLLRSAGVERVYWYLMRDYNKFTTGLVHSDKDPLGRYTPTAAYPAYATLNRVLGASTPVRREATDPRTRMYLFHRPDGRELRVAWSTAGSAPLVLDADAPLVVTDLMGGTRTLKPTGGTVRLTVDENPVYVAGAVTAVREDRRDVLLADSTDGFSGSQGDADGTWSYGFYDGDPAAYAPDAVRPMTWTRHPWGYRWQGPYPFAEIDVDNTHPSAHGGRPVWTVRRWRSGAAGAARITGTAGRAAGAGGDGTGLKVLVDGKEMFARTVGAPGGPASVSCDLPVTLQAGTRVDFAATPGPGTNIDFDDLTFTAQISGSRP